jgi:hypothetical protein
MSENLNPITYFAKTNFRNKEVPFGIKLDDRRRHMYVIGKTGVGKTTLLENMVIQDIQNNHGVCFIDPNGDSVNKILDHIPPNRINDVIYFNPADLEYPIAFNVMEAVETKYKHLVASGLMGVFTKIFAGTFSARMEYILNNTILALLESPGNTMLGIVRMYVDKKYRKKIVDNVQDPIVKSFWVDEFANYAEKFRTEAVAPIQNKVGQFLASSVIRNIVGQPKSTLDIRNIMDTGKILLVDLSKGRVGENNAELIGSMLITRIQLAAFSRADILEEDRKDFFLHVDEFQNFVTDSFATILSEARKYRLGLTISHQYIGQLTPDHNNTKVRDAVFGNVGTLASFRVGAEDAEFLEKEFGPTFTMNDLINLPKANIILKLSIDGVASEPFSATTLPPISESFTASKEKVVKVSRERYGNPVKSVEEKIARWMGADFHEGTAQLVLGEQKEDSEFAYLPKNQKPQEPQPISAPEEDETENEIPPVPVPTPPEVTPKPQERLNELKSQIVKPERFNNSPKPQPNRTQNHFHSDNRNFKKPKPKNNSKPVKNNHPIWDTVANLEAEKKKIQPGDTIILGGGYTYPKNDDSKTPLKPGEVHKLV